MMVMKIKNQKAQKSVTLKKNKLGDYKNCLEATQFEKEIK